MIEFLRLHSLLATVIILIAGGTGLAQEPAGRKLYPVDASHLDPSFAEFKTRLLEAVERRDFDFLLSIAHPKLRLSIEDPPNISGQENLHGLWASMREVDKTQKWQELRDMLSLGAVRRSDSRFCAPYVSYKFPHDLPIVDYVVITGSDVPIRAQPKSTAPIIDHLSYDIVKYLWRGDRSGWETVEGESYMWYRIQTPSGETGFVWKYVGGPFDTSVCFVKTDGQWLMWSWSGGD